MKYYEIVSTNSFGQVIGNYGQFDNLADGKLVENIARLRKLYGENSSIKFHVMLCEEMSI